MSDSLTSVALWGVRKEGRGEENVGDNKEPGFIERGKETVLKQGKNSFFQMLCLPTRVSR